MQRRTKIIAGVGAAVLAVSVGAGFALAGEAGDSDEPITGPALAKASAAALEHTGRGRVTGTEVGDEESLYEVEVTLGDGSQVDVQLDSRFHVVGSDADSDHTEDEGQADD